MCLQPHASHRLCANSIKGVHMRNASLDPDPAEPVSFCHCGAGLSSVSCCWDADIFDAVLLPL